MYGVNHQFLNFFLFDLDHPPDRSHPGMLDAHMTFQVLEVGVLLVADLTDLVGNYLVIHVDDALVAVQLRLPGKTLAADVTGERPLAGMASLVFLQRRFVDELLAAQSAAVRMFPCVSQHVFPAVS